MELSQNLPMQERLEMRDLIVKALSPPKISYPRDWLVEAFNSEFKESDAPIWNAYYDSKDWNLRKAAIDHCAELLLRGHPHEGCVSIAKKLVKEPDFEITIRRNFADLLFKNYQIEVKLPGTCMLLFQRLFRLKD